MQTTTVDAAPLVTALEQLAPGNHVCSIYDNSAERYAVAVPFIRIGLDRGEKCVYVADDGTEAAARDAMRAGGIDVEHAIANGSLVLATKEAAYLKHGSFDPDWMLTFWPDAAAEAMREGFSALRGTGETEWVVCCAPGCDRWMEYESRVTDMLANLNAVLLCQYNRRIASPEFVLDIIRTHPTVVYRGVVCRNMYHVPSDEFLATDQPAREVERLLTNIRERAEIERESRQQLEEVRLANEALRASEQRWRSVFETSAIGMAIGDETARLLAWNQAFQALVGYSDEELLGLTVYDLTHEADIPRNLELRAELLSGARPEMQMEKRLRRKDQSFIWVRVTSSLVPATERTPVYVIAFVEDITARRHAEHQLEASLGQSRAIAGRLMHAQDDERRRIAQMLHETTAQDLAALKMHLARLNRTVGHLSETDRAALTESISLAEQSITEIRTLSYLLHPPFLDEMGLLSALRWYTAGFAERSGISVELDLPESFERLLLDTETALFRIVQESLINIHRHSESETARIWLRRDAELLVLTVEDRGHGFRSGSLEQIMSGGGVVGVGIAGMRERMEQLGGRLEISSDDHGTTVRARLPLSDDAG